MHKESIAAVKQAYLLKSSDKDNKRVTDSSINEEFTNKLQRLRNISRNATRGVCLVALLKKEDE